MNAFLKWSLCAMAAVVVAMNGAIATETLHIETALTGAQEVPPSDSAGTGTATFTLDETTHHLTWSIATEGLTGDAVAAHIHGPADPGANGGVVINLAPDGAANPLTGGATLTAEQAAALMDGKYYVNIHTAENPAGEVRGQVTP